MKNLKNDQVVLFELPKSEIADTNPVGFTKETVLAKVSLGLYAQRILRVCASQIQDDDPDDKVYSFLISDFADYFGLSSDKIHPKIRSALIQLRSATIILPIDKGRVTGYINWGQISAGKVDISFDPELKPLYQKNLKGKYPLRYIRGFAYSYTYRFYELFLYKLQTGNRKDRVKFYITVDELRDWLHLENSYKNYADIRKRIIIPIVADINGEKLNAGSKIVENDYCNLQVSFSEVKSGRKITGIEFDVVRKENTDLIELHGFTFGDDTIYETLDEDSKKAYEEFRKWKVSRNTISEAYSLYGPDGFYKIYLNVKEAVNNGSVKNKTNYASQCLKNGFMLDDEKFGKIKTAKQLLKENTAALEEIGYITEFEKIVMELSEDEKEKIVAELKENQLYKTVLDGKKFDDILKEPMSRSILMKYVKENYKS